MGLPPPDEHWEVFIGAQAEGEEDLLMTLAGQLLRIPAWAEETETKGGYSKKHKAFCEQFGLKPEGKTGRINVATFKDAALFTSMARDLGPCPYAAIDVDFAALPAATATRSGKVWCDQGKQHAALHKLAWREPKTPCVGFGKAKKNKPFSFNMSGGQIEALEKAKKAIGTCPWCNSVLAYEQSESKTEGTSKDSKLK